MLGGKRKMHRLSLRSLRFHKRQSGVESVPFVMCCHLINRVTRRAHRLRRHTPLVLSSANCPDPSGVERISDVQRLPLSGRASLGSWRFLRSPVRMCRPNCRISSSATAAKSRRIWNVAFGRVRPNQLDRDRGARESYLID